jgi:ParB-like chromosome segregation protein Spo0J
MSEPVPHRNAAERAALEGGAMARWLQPTSQSRIERIPCESIDDRRLLGDVDGDDAAVALRLSIAHRGIVEPLLLRPLGDGRFEVVTGGRRLAAARELKLATIPAIVRELDDAEAALVTVWAILPRLDAADLAGVAEHLSAAGIPAGEVALLLAAGRRRPLPAATPALRLRSSAPLRFAAPASPVARLLDALGERRDAALAAVARVEPARA